MGKGKKIICIDFDGVLHSYKSGWQGIDVIPDPPVPVAIEFLRRMIHDDRFTPMVFSSRSREPEGIKAMQEWLGFHGLKEEELIALPFPIEKPAAFMTIDDRAFPFEGHFPTPDWIDTFKPWHQLTEQERLERARSGRR